MRHEEDDAAGSAAVLARLGEDDALRTDKEREACVPPGKLVLAGVPRRRSRMARMCWWGLGSGARLAGLKAEGERKKNTPLDPHKKKTRMRSAL